MMRWPPWKPDPRVVEERQEAKQLLDHIRAQRPRVEEAAERLNEGMRVNHLRDKAFAIRERGNR